MDFEIHQISRIFFALFHVISMITLAVGGFGLITISARPGLANLKVGGYALCAIAISSVFGVALEFVLQFFGLRHELVSYWFMARGIIGNGIDILGYGVFAFGIFTAARASQPTQLSSSEGRG